MQKQYTYLREIILAGIAVDLAAVPAEAFSREEEVLEFRKLSAFSPEGDPSEALAGTAVDLGTRGG